MDKDNLDSLATQILNSPLAILPAKMEVLAKMLTGEIEFNMQIRDPVSTNRVEIGVIPVIGTILHRSYWRTSYEEIRQAFRNALGDTSISAILFDVDSPGGTVAGCFDLVDEIYQARGQKPIYAFANESAYSGAYAIASAADRIFLPRTGGVGSIGARMMHVDWTEWNKKSGIKITHLFKGDRKIDFDPDSPLSKEAREAAMKDLDAIYDLFVATVARNRGIKESQVRATEAGLFQGQNAVDAGLADQVMTFNEAIQTIGDDVAVNSNLKLSGSVETSTKDEEVKGMFKTLAEMKAEAPELYEALMKEARAAAESDLRATFETEKKGLEGEIVTLKTELTQRDTRISRLETKEAVRTEKEVNERIDREVEDIWKTALSNSDIPERFWPKVKGHVNKNQFVKGEQPVERALDKATFTAAVDEEIKECEGLGMKTEILGTGFTNKTGDDIDIETEAKLAAEDDKWVENMAVMAGEKPKKGGDE